MLNVAREPRPSRTSEWRASQPMAPKRNPNALQKPCDLGLFDMEGRRQIDWIDEARKGKR